MTVYFIGAGPGAADLITVRGADLLSRCRTCLYAGSLVPVELLDRCPPNALLVNTAQMPLTQIVEQIVLADARGDDIARLHSGDPSLYSAVAEQIRELRSAGIDYQIVPGVPAFAAAAASLGRELTVPGVGQSLLITRVSTVSSSMPDGEQLAELGRSAVTLAIHLAAHRIRQVVSDLTPHYGDDCPAAVVAYASRPNQHIIRTTLRGLAEAVEKAEIARTAVIFVGQVLADNDFSDSYLYSQARMTKLRHEHTRPDR